MGERPERPVVEGGVLEEATGKIIKEVATMLCPRCRRAMAVQFTKDATGKKVRKFNCPECGTLIEEEEEEKKGCFIATAAYGTPFATEINVLRWWRDNVLITHSLGKLFVKFYYTISPPIAKVVAKSEFLKFIVRSALDPVIKFLKTKQTKKQ